MKVYIGWYDDISLKIALILKACLPIMNDYIETSVVTDNMERNEMARCRSLSEMFSSCDCALFCVTKENINSPWLYYEVGAMLEKTVFVILFDVPRPQLSILLGQFRSVTLTKDSKLTKESMRVLTHELNALCVKRGYAVSSRTLDERFDALYPTTEKMLAGVRKAREEREREEYEREKRTWKELPRMDGENLQQDFRTLNSKLDAILSQLSKVSAGNVDGKAE